MGAEGSKKVVREQKEYFSPEERQSVLAVAQKLAGSNGNITLPTLEKHIAKWYSPEIASRFIKVFLRGKTPTPTSLTCQMLVDTLGPLTKGTLEQHLYLTLTLAGGDQAGVDSDSIIKYLEVILGAYLKMVLGGAGCRGWSCGSGHKSIGHVCRAVLHDLLHAGASFKETWRKPPPKAQYSYEVFEQWYLGHSLFTTLETEVVGGCFSVSTAGPTNLLPQPSLVPKTFPNLLSAAQVLFLNSSLPTTLQTEWRFLFSTTTHGWSFSIFMKQIVGKGPTLLIVEDQSGNKFGGFASVSWGVKPQFQGTPECFLFALEPQIGVFHSTGYNTNFMYLNYLEKNTMPNGLGMGGREELFGLWLDYDFGKGSVSPSCTTFRSPQLSPNQQLEIKSIEVWAVGPEEEDSDDEDQKKSALDRNPEASAMLEMMGKGRVSEGLREEDKD
ncbi:MTOR-associated protein MEAK7-like [Portunus trituberculatus]|nr:MTOR-associated protein MEAK7-like [Portunus trituberculatus]XP_045125361.1 MTOR-associated protein MEAK7-like [Portunus trituberculatus]XP_045125362.1 MTOR-associated protein MEAK7-like [Portunus trituberculatus]XP_045125363.1 MTOR-associated protein MEAK7-like [Portunus trituberculatus]XP_045125364.1 MTOR-associated protein MEAK7-like [Portunus trituberculatus]XP_045125365.1 MTOR-associated protein MEAK7-like [Portunus trituberculatus]